MHFNDPQIRSGGDFKNPYNNVKVPENHYTKKRDPVDSILQTFARPPASENVEASGTDSVLSPDEKEATDSRNSTTDHANSSFDWNKTNAERFTRSPCVTQLGFDPYMDPSLQEKRYEDCESDLRDKSIGKGFLGFIIIGGLSVIVYLGLNAKQG